MDHFEDPSVLKKRLLVGCCGTVILFCLDWLLTDFAADGLLELALAAVVCLTNGRVFVRGVSALTSRHPGASAHQALTALAAALCMGYGIAAVIQRMLGTPAEEAPYLFAPAAAILTFGTAAELAAARFARQAAAPLTELEGRMPASASVLRDRKPCTVAAAELRRDDIFLLRPGDPIPADGVVLDGTSTLTVPLPLGSGEPEELQKGSAVLAGTVNGDGALICRAVRVGDDTALAGILHTARQTAAGTMPAADKVRRLCDLYVPACAGVAAVVFIVWLLVGRGVGFAFSRAVAVLAVGSPLALAIAGAAALMAGVGQGVKQGILFTDASVPQTAAALRGVLLDKRGTITTGAPEVAEIVGTRNVPPKFLLGMAAGLESQSTDPMASAIMRRAQSEKIRLSTVRDCEAVPGQGLVGRFAGKVMAGGSESFIASYCELTDDLRDAGRRLMNEGVTPLYFSLDGHPAGLIGISEQVRPSARQAVTELQALGLDVKLLSGDNAETANRIGHLVGLTDDNIRAAIAPEALADEVRRCQAGEPCALVGDARSAAAALDAAELGIAMGTEGFPPAGKAGILLTQRDLTGVPAALRLARQMTGAVGPMERFVLVYHLIALLLAAGITVPLGLVVPPAVAAIAALAAALAAVRMASGLTEAPQQQPAAEEPEPAGVGA